VGASEPDRTVSFLVEVTAISSDPVAVGNRLCESARARMSHYYADDRSCRAVIRVAEILLKTSKHKLRCVVIGRSRVMRVHGLPQLGEAEFCVILP